MKMRLDTSSTCRNLLAVLLLMAVVAFAAAGAAGSAQAALPAWTTYHHDAERTGSDPDGTSPLVPSAAWQSPDLGAPIWGQPLILGSRVYVTTVGDGVYALDASTGALVWHVSAGTPVSSTSLPCGDITPTVGIVGTPVVDQAAGVLYAVADTWNGTQAQHLLEGFRLSDGERVLSTPVDPPGQDPKAILQRTALNLDGSNVIFGYGGNDGDCSIYKGAVVSVPESGAAPSYWQVPIASPSTGGGAVWATGGPAVNSAGSIFASTGNPNPPSGQEATVFDDSDALVALNPALGLSGWFEPPSWQEDSNTDRDLASGAPELLPGGLVFEAGKNGTGYLLDQSALAGGGSAVFSHQVCGGSGSFGGDSYFAGVIYLPCTNGTQALSYDATARTFTPLWKGPADAFGPPIVSAGLVWTVATGGFSGGGTKLYGLDPGTGAVRYTEALPSPVADHFASPSAAGGRLLVATGATVSAFQTAVLTAVGEPTQPGNPSSPTPGISSLRPIVPTPLLALLRNRLQVGSRGRVRLLIRCPTSLTCGGGVTMRAAVRTPIRGAHHRTRLLHLEIARSSFKGRKGQFTLVLHLDSKAQKLLRRRRHRLHVTLTLSLTGVSIRKVDAILTG